MDDLFHETFGEKTEKGAKLSDDDENQEEKQEEGAEKVEENKEPAVENEMTLTE